MEAKKIRLTKDKDMYLATLYGKAMDAAAPDPILGDHFAAQPSRASISTSRR